MFKMPINEEDFIARGLPGNYEELRNKYASGDLISEMDTCVKKRLCILKAIDNNGDCYLVPVENKNGEPIKVSKL